MGTHQAVPGGFQPFLHRIAEETLKGYSCIKKFGHNADVAATLETIWSGSIMYSYFTSAEILKINSTNTADNGGGIGARTVEIFGLDDNYDEINEVVALHATVGTTFVTTVNSYLRIYRVIVKSAGSNDKNVGTIEIYNNAETTLMGQVEIGESQSNMSLWTAPANKTAFIVSYYGSSNTVLSSEVKLYVRPLGEVFQVKHHQHFKQSHFQHIFVIPLRVRPKSDIEMRGLAEGGGGDITGGFDIYWR